MWIIFEGLDKAGKGTLEQELFKRTNYSQIMVDRGPVGFKVFDEIFKRSSYKTHQKWFEQIKICNDLNMIVVYCHCDEEVALKRIKDHEEECPYNYSYAQNLLRSNIYRFYKNIIDIDTTNKTIDECIDRIMLEREGFLNGRSSPS